MKKILLIITLLFLTPQNVLAADTWEDFYDEETNDTTIQNYTTAIKSGFTCTYNSSNFPDFSNIIFQFSQNGWNAIIGNSQFTICGPNDCSRYNSPFNYANKNFYFTAFSLNEYLDNYLSTQACPSNIYLESTDDRIAIYSHYINDNLTTFSLDPSSSNVNEPNSETGCLLDEAYCENYVLQDIDGNQIVVQLGRKDDGINREDTKYFAVDENSSFTNHQIISFTSNNSSVSLVYDGITYTIPSNQISLLYPERGSFIDPNYLTLSFYDSTDTTYYLSWYNFNDPDDIRNQYTNNTGLINSSEELEPLEIVDIEFCEENGVRRAFQIVGYLFYAAKIIVPLLLIIFGSIDFAKATIASDEKAPKDAALSLAKRIIAAILIFLIPTILNFLISLINDASEHFSDSKYTDCTDCLLDPFGECQAGDVVSGDSEEE